MTQHTKDMIPWGVLVTIALALAGVIARGAVAMADVSSLRKDVDMHDTDLRSNAVQHQKFEDTIRENRKQNERVENALKEFTDEMRKRR